MGWYTWGLPLVARENGMPTWGDVKTLDCPVCGHHTDDPKLKWVAATYNGYGSTSEYVEVICGRCSYYEKVYPK